MLAKFQSLSLASVQEAHSLIRLKVHRTPALMSTSLSEIASTPCKPDLHESMASKPNVKLFFKCENLQKTGSFKFRGTTHSLARLTDRELKNGVLTYSTGESPADVSKIFHHCQGI
jgi:threonine dehydratase